MENRLCEKCKEIIELLINDKIRFKSVVMQKLAEAYLKAKSCGCKDVEEIVKDLLIFLDM